MTYSITSLIYYITHSYHHSTITLLDHYITRPLHYSTITLLDHYIAHPLHRSSITSLIHYITRPLHRPSITPLIHYILTSLHTHIITYSHHYIITSLPTHIITYIRYTLLIWSYFLNRYYLDRYYLRRYYLVHYTTHSNHTISSYILLYISHMLIGPPGTSHLSGIPSRRGGQTGRRCIMKLTTTASADRMESSMMTSGTRESPFCMSSMLCVHACETELYLFWPLEVGCPLTITKGDFWYLPVKKSWLDKLDEWAIFGAKSNTLCYMFSAWLEFFFLSKFI
jgi:hypothetical protein